MAELDRTAITDTGFLRLPVGTSVQRDNITTPSLGMTRWNSDDKNLEFFNGAFWTTLAGGGGGGSLFSSITSLNNILPTFTYTQVSSIKTEIENAGFTLVATPTWNGVAEQLAGTTSISSLGQFLYTEWDSGTTLALSDGFSTSALNGIPYMAMAGFGPNGYNGIAVMFYRDYTSAALRDFFAPNQNRNLYCYVLNANGTEVIDTSGTTSTIYSDGQSPNANGYNSTTRFASDDGCWGFRIGASRLDGNGGPYLSADSANAYGCENRNGSDSVQEYYWGSASNTSTTSFGFYSFVKNA